MSLETNGFYTDINKLIADTRIGRPHVVILGAGASIAAFPDGDRNGYKLPMMSNLIETVELDHELNKHGITYEGRNFEEVYSELNRNPKYKRVIETINTKIWDYFSRLRLPDYPTIYDHLVLSLRDKDLIATFNWDPFLYQACWRHNKKAKLPMVAYLHGSVSIGYCLTDMRKGLIGRRCSVCNKQYSPSKLLYPIKKKDYSLDPFIRGEWKALRGYLEHAYMLTIFGYSAPQSDVEAIELMKGAWGDKYKRDIEQIEIVDLKSGEELRETWQAFIHTHHYDVTNDFYKSSIGLFPRRTCEAEWNYSMPEKLEFYPQNPIPRNLGFEELWDWYLPLIKAEKKKA
jgi:hypothetical protein